MLARCITRCKGLRSIHRPCEWVGQVQVSLHQSKHASRKACKDPDFYCDWLIMKFSLKKVTHITIRCSCSCSCMLPVIRGASVTFVSFVSIPLKVSQLNIFIPILDGEIALFHNWTLTFLSTFFWKLFHHASNHHTIIYIENIFITWFTTLKIFLLIMNIGGWKLVSTQQINNKRWSGMSIRFTGNDLSNMWKLFIHSIALSTLIHKDAIWQVVINSCCESCCLPRKNGGIFKCTPKVLSHILYQGHNWPPLNYWVQASVGSYSFELFNLLKQTLSKGTKQKQ